MSNTVENLTSLLELPGLCNLVKDYSNCSIKADNKFLNRKQFRSMKHENTIIVFSYGDLVLIDPELMFRDSTIKTFTSKGSVTLIGNAVALFLNAASFNSDLSSWNVANVECMVSMFEGATSFTSDLSRWNVGKVTNMCYMFTGANLFNSDLNRWNVSNVKNMTFCLKMRFLSMQI